MACSRPLTTASSLFRRLHRLTTHSFSTGHPTNTNFRNSSGVGDAIEAKKRMKLVNDSFYCISVDVPGLTKNELNMWLDAKKDIRYEGKCKGEAKYGDVGRLYKGTIEGRPLLIRVCDMDQLKAELNHGVLYITLPLKEDAKMHIQRKREKLEKEKGQL
ncbi:uncharacterized protein LOC132304058 [Cornus florida]|uniref:uncharacterized protein LOC132304058 n=1 Tax=Cornus florida TaxID=4283 RepID=UPI002897BF1A|nr:uncharacterized protein LOC132304058 [Cornus florida]